ncbi:MAG: peptidylprolyl isomerase [Deltaproteobacteria bacterium]|nr:peptidylprolyl isomerase [Deltaproteobacteria bacterium]
MKVSKVSSIFILSAVLGIICNSPVPADICNRIVAAVNNEVVTLLELNNKIRELTGIEAANLEKQDKSGYLEARKRVLDLLIDEKISQNKVREIGIEVSPNEIDQGISYEDYKNNIKQELEQMRLIDFEVKSKIIIREETIKKYYDEHIDTFRTEEEVRLAIILLVKGDSPYRDEKVSLFQKAEKIVSMLKDGEDFGELAKKFSQGPGAEDGGNLGSFKTSQLDPKLKGVIKEMAVGDISDPIVGPSGIQIIKILEKQDKGVKTIEEVRNAIYDVLYGKEIENGYSSWIKELRQEAFIKIIF